MIHCSRKITQITHDLAWSECLSCQASTTFTSRRSAIEGDLATLGLWISGSNVEAWANQTENQAYGVTRYGQIVRRRIHERYRCRTAPTYFPVISAASCVVNGSNDRRFHTEQDMTLIKEVQIGHFAPDNRQTGSPSLADGD